MSVGLMTCSTASVTSGAEKTYDVVNANLALNPDSHDTPAHTVHQAASDHSSDGHTMDEPRPYDALADAHEDVKLTLAAAEEAGKMSLIVMGANWCHDSRGLAAQFEKERFQTLLDEHYSLVYVDVGQKNRNIDIAQRFGVDNIVGTPTVFVVSSMGEVLNLDTAPTWRNAASRTEDEIFDYFEGFTAPVK
jgi:thiol-disulfide isomerase/thioredoxin